MKAVNSPHLVLGSELVADFRVKTKASTPCGSPGPGLATPGLGGLIMYWMMMDKADGLDGDGASLFETVALQF